MILLKPLTPAQAKAKMDNNCRLKVIVGVDLETLIDHNLDGLNDYVESLIIEEGLLSDIYYNVVGHEREEQANFVAGIVYLEVDAEWVDSDGDFDDDED